MIGNIDSDGRASNPDDQEDSGYGYERGRDTGSSCLDFYSLCAGSCVR